MGMPSQMVAVCNLLNKKTDKKQCRDCERGGKTVEERKDCSSKNVTLKNKKKR